MRILFILHQFYPEFASGTERVTLNLARSAQRAGHHVCVLAATIDPTLCKGKPSNEVIGAFQSVYEGIPVMFLPRSLLPESSDHSFEFNPILVNQLEAWVAEMHFDLAHVLHPMRMASALLAVQRTNLPYLFTLTDFFSACFRINLVDASNQVCLGPQEGRLCADICLTAPWSKDSLLQRYLYGKRLLAGAGARICPSEYVASRYRAIFPDLDFRVIPHGLDLLEFVATRRTNKTFEKVGVTLGYIGTVVPQKGLDTLLRAFIQVPDQNLKLRIAGGFYGDSAYHKEIQKLVEADPRIELLGQLSQTEVLDMLQSIDVLCLPSRVPETFSLALHEAFAAGVPAFVSNIGAPGEIVFEQGSGRVLPLEDVEAWRLAIVDLVTHPGQLDDWRFKLPLPLRIEEEAFFYESHYRSLLHPD